MKNKFLCALAFIVILPLVANAQSLSERRKAKEQAVQFSAEVAAGRPDKEGFAVVAPALNERLGDKNITLTRLSGKGSVESVDALCDGDVNMAFVQADVLVQRVSGVNANKSDCSNKLVILGPALWPYVIYAIVLNDEKSPDSLDGMFSNLRSGNSLRIAAGGSGSGGEQTLRNILNANSTWKQATSIQPDGADTAFSKLKDKVIDVFVVADGPHSPLLNQVRDEINPDTKKPRYKFVSIESDKLLASTFNRGQKLYGSYKLSGGWFSSRNTIVTLGVLAVRDDFYRANGAVMANIRQAEEDSLPDIATKTGAETNWFAKYFN